MTDTRRFFRMLVELHERPLVVVEEGGHHPKGEGWFYDQELKSVLIYEDASSDFTLNHRLHAKAVETHEPLKGSDFV